MKAQTWKLAGTALALVILANTVPAQNPARAAKPAALVNGEPIYLADVDAIMKKQPPPPHPLTEAQKREVRREIVEMLIDDALMQQFLRKNTQPVDKAAV